MAKHPEVLWAQRSSRTVAEKNVIYLTVNLPDIVESTLKYTLSSTKISFSAQTSGEPSDYAFDLELYAEVDPEHSTRRLTSRALVATLRKKELQSEYWSRLTKEKLRTPFIKTDFSKWVDEDDQDGNPGLDDIDDMPGGIPGLGDMGDMPGMPPGMNLRDLDLSQDSGDSAKGEPNEADESDDDGPPPLEDVEPSK